MPVKTAIGKSTSVSYPAAGTLKPSTGLSAISATGLQKSKKTNQSSSSKIEKEEQSDPTEIVALADFNRVYDSAKTLTDYGNYYGALEVVHAVMTDDVTYVVKTAIEKDSSGQWKSLRDSVESSSDDAEDLNEDLANVDSKIEQACKSLDFLRKGDDEIQEETEKFLSGKIKPYETPAANRTIDIDSILEPDASGLPASERFSSTGGGVSALKSVLYSTIASKIVDPPSIEAFDGIGQSKSSKDLNPSDPKGIVWDYVDQMTSKGAASVATSSTRLAESVKMLSHVLSISSGIRKVEQDALSSRILFSPSRLGSMFDGTRSNAPVPYRKSKNSPNYGSDLVSLSLLQFNSSDGSIVVPVEQEDDISKKYRSGASVLIRGAINSGEYKFSDFASYINSFEEGRQDIESYAEMMLGYLDVENKLTPSETLRIIASNFADALESAKSDEKSRFQLLYTSVAGNSTGTNSKLMRQRLLQIAGRIKYYQLKRGESFTGSGDDATKKTTLITNKTSTGSETLKGDASATTIQTEDKSDASTERVIARTAAGSPRSDILALSMLSTLASVARQGGPTAEALNYTISRISNSIKTLSSIVSSYEPYKNDESYKDQYEYYKQRVNNLVSYRNDLYSQLRATPDYIDVSEVRGYFEESMKTTSGTFWSYMVKAYDDIVESALKRLPSDTKLTDELGKTAHGAFDEFGIMSFIVESFVALSAPMKLSVQKSASGSVSYDEAFENALNLAESFIGIETNIRSSIPNIAIVGYSASNLTDYRDELVLLTSDRTPEQIGELAFDSASEVKAALDIVQSPITRYQNAMAYLSAFSDVMSRSKDDLVAAFQNILETPARRAALDNEQGRKMMSALTNQQMVYRRSLVDRYRASSERGYLPARFAYSENESAALAEILSSASFCSNLSENTRIVAVAVPAGTVDSSKKYNDPDLGKQNYTGMLELMTYRRDHELDDLIFEEKIFLFDPQLYVIPDSFVNYKSSRGATESDAALQVAKKITFRLYSRDGSKILSYADFASEERYQSLTSKQIDDILRNTTLSYMMETYLFKTTGMIFDESLTLNLDDSISPAGESALISLASQNLPNLILPTADQVDALIGSDGEVDYFSNISGLTTGDRELIAALGSSYIMRSEKLSDRLVKDCRFDRVFIITIDPDSFGIDRAETISKNGNAGKQMLLSLQKQGLLRRDGRSFKIVARDPINGGFSIGDVACQFVPHTASKTEGSLIKLAKDFTKLRSEKSNSAKTKASNAASKSSINNQGTRAPKGVKL